ncbi:hypothetical protein DFQ11_105160 [Winogradskyella epiphytica]|uniref:Uncharacterized protein n=1 Tax=Winogradskyella epiphytica TaxID=262005 RepID=A0A2V4XRR6_9FLAO|nr:hypothetical protein [Winogradskyella epiphytica]PYE80561.1 hypothetical protein DFQ11_105160 [Winogradskyella epiphytica]GGW68608.1 hypothetical protein GCM10008085_20560 [Winogradskyella epiphytica]
MRLIAQELINIWYKSGPHDNNVAIQLESTEDYYYAKNVTLNITALELNGGTVTRSKGTFSGDFYRHNLVEADVHTINDGEFEIIQ